MGIRDSKSPKIRPKGFSEDYLGGYRTDWRLDGKIKFLQTFALPKKKVFNEKTSNIFCFSYIHSMLLWSMIYKSWCFLLLSLHRTLQNMYEDIMHSFVKWQEDSADWKCCSRCSSVPVASSSCAYRHCRWPFKPLLTLNLFALLISPEPCQYSSKRSL